MKRIFSTLAIVMLLVSCNSSGPKQKTKRTIVCTTSMVADAVRNLVPKNIEVISLMGPGIDPHLYKATQGDLVRLQEADAVVYNGLHLEGKMGDVLEKLGRIKPVFAIAESLPDSLLISPQNSGQSHDPHIWFDLSLWNHAIAGFIAEFGEEFPEWQDDIDHNYFEFKQDLLATHNWAQNKLDSIPVDKRILITAHDAFAYYGRAYNLEVKGLQGISTASEFGLRDVSQLVNYIVEKQIPAVFVESSVPKKSIEAVIAGCRARGHNVVLGGQLYSDALGTEGTPEATLIGTFKANTKTVASSLKQPVTAK